MNYKTQRFAASLAVILLLAGCSSHNPGKTIRLAFKTDAYGRPGPMRVIESSGNKKTDSEAKEMATLELKTRKKALPPNKVGFIPV